jgi:two-component system osmolarity sensor histidine kinase EnvZ
MLQAILATLGAVREGWRSFAHAVGQAMPKGLYARSLIIIIAPIVILEAVVAFVFMERHWQTVTARLSAAVVGDIGSLIDMLAVYPQDQDYSKLTAIAQERMHLTVTVLPAQPLPPPAPKPFFTLLDQTLSREISKQINLPFWIDTVGRSNLIEIRIQLPDKTLRVIAPRSQAYASNSHIFILWMVGSSLVILTIAILFLRNQIRPILRLAEAAESFGRGQSARSFTPRGAREVRQAARAFIGMRSRIERQMEQRTTMLAGVSHDLRTVLTRFRLSLAFFEGPDAEALVRDVDEMQAMLEGYLAFAKGDAAEESQPVDVVAILEQVAADTRAAGASATVTYSGDTTVKLRPQGMRRLLTNLASNAARHGDRVEISGDRRPGWLIITIDDDGEGIPPDQYDTVFKPFVRLDEARNLDESGTGLGLAIALDIARVHGGDITLDKSPLGGLRATVKLPA